MRLIVIIIIIFLSIDNTKNNAYTANDAQREGWTIVSDFLSGSSFHKLTDNNFKNNEKLAVSGGNFKQNKCML